jgi:hypothetical protein
MARVELWTTLSCHTPGLVAEPEERSIMSSSWRLSDPEWARLFPSDSELARRMRALDWFQTDLGPPEHLLLNQPSILAD